MTGRNIALLKYDDGGNHYRLDACIYADGDLAIEGHDFGGSVERFWGYSEYEWVITVRAENMPLLVAALDGNKGDDALALLAARHAVDEKAASKTFLEEHGVPIEFWSHVGD